MKLVKTNQDLIVGRKYLCRTKPIQVQNGSFTKPELSILHVGEDSGRRYVGPNKFWAFDAGDKLISYNGNQRISSESTLLGIPFQEVEKIEEDYEVNSQALPRWDMIGPIPEIQEGILHNLFDYPSLLKAFDNPVIVHPDGSIGLHIPEITTNASDDDWYWIDDKDSARELNAELEANEKIDNPINEVEEIMKKAMNKTKPDIQNPIYSQSAFITYSINQISGKQVILTENKYVHEGYFPKGTVMTIVGFSSGVNLREDISGLIIHNVGDGFDFIDEASSQPTSWSNLTKNPMQPEFPPNEFGHPSFAKNPIGLLSSFQQLDRAIDISIDIARGSNAQNMGFFMQPGQRKTKEEKKQFLEQYLQYLSTQPY